MRLQQLQCLCYVKLNVRNLYLHLKLHIKNLIDKIKHNTFTR